MCFTGGGSIETPLQQVEELPEGGPTGTTVRFWPDPTIFDEVAFQADRLTERLQVMAFLNAGLRIRFRDLRNSPASRWTTYRYTGGIEDFVRHVNASKESLFDDVGYLSQAEADQEVEVAFQWSTAYNTDGLYSFANGITTTEGGMHEEGFRKALTGAVNRYADRKGLLRGVDNLQGEDIREGLTAIVSVRLREPQFEGQTKSKLGNVSIRTLVERATNRHLGRLAGGASHRSAPHRHQGRRSLACSRGRPRGPRGHPPEVGSERRRAAGQAHRLHVREHRRERVVHRGG